MDEVREEFENARHWAKPKSIFGVWMVRLSAASLFFGAIGGLVHWCSGCPWIPIYVGVGFALGAVIARLPIGVRPWERKVASLIQTSLLLGLAWAIPVWVVGFSERFNWDEFKAETPGLASRGPMLTPDGELIARHRFETPGDAVAAYGGVVVAAVICLAPIWAITATLLLRLMIIWFGEEMFVIAASLLRFGWTLSGYVFLFGILAYAAKHPICPVSTLVVTGCCAVGCYVVAWLIDPRNLGKLLRN